MGWVTGQGREHCHPQASAAASVGMVEVVRRVVQVMVLEVELVVVVVVMEAHTGPLIHMAGVVVMMMMLMNVSQRAPALEEPTLGSPGSPDSAFSSSWKVPLHVMVLWFVEKADGQ